jgi:hypothetical protein
MGLGVGGAARGGGRRGLFGSVAAVPGTLVFGALGLAGVVRPARYCSPRHLTRYEPLYIELHSIMCCGEQHMPGPLPVKSSTRVMKSQAYRPPHHTHAF